MATTKQLYANNAKSTLSTLISSTDTTIALADGSLFPTPGVGEYFLVTLEYGGIIEVIKVQGKSGNNLTSCVRGQENTSAAGFPSGTRVECRITRDTLASFSRKVDKMDEVTNVDVLNAPTASNSNSYITGSVDDSSNPIIAIKNVSTPSLWRFSSHSLVLVSGSATSATSTTVTSTAIANLVSNMVAGKYIIQFVTGVNIGLSRMITASSTNTVSWVTPFTSIPGAGDQFEIYKSDASNLKELIAASQTVPSDPSKANLASPTFTGTVYISQILKTVNTVDVKSTLTANSATTALDLSTGSVFKVTIAATTTFQFNNPPSGTDVFSFTLITVNDSTAGRGVSFPSGKMKYAGGLVPPRTTTANAVDVWTFFTDDAGTTWNASLAIADLH